MKKIDKKTTLLKDEHGIIYTPYPGEYLIDDIMGLMIKNLSEPYPIYTYRHFLNNYSDLCIMCFDSNKNEKKEVDNFVAGIIGGIETSNNNVKKGYIAMIAVKDEYRGKKIAQNIVKLFIERITKNYDLDEIYLETESDNTAALGLYESLGFVRVKLNTNYYLNGKSAYKLKLWLK